MWTFEYCIKRGYKRNGKNFNTLDECLSKLYAFLDAHAVDDMFPAVRLVKLADNVSRETKE